MFKNNEGSYPAVGQFFLAVSPGRFNNENPNQFAERLETMLGALVNEPGVRLPGGRRQDCREKADNEGVEVPTELYDKLVSFAA